MSLPTFCSRALPVARCTPGSHALVAPGHFAAQPCDPASCGYARDLTKERPPRVAKDRAPRVHFRIIAGGQAPALLCGRRAPEPEFAIGATLAAVRARLVPFDAVTCRACRRRLAADLAAAEGR